jgi:hypothetical protein
VRQGGSPASGRAGAREGGFRFQSTAGNPRTGKPVSRGRGFSVQVWGSIAERRVRRATGESSRGSWPQEDAEGAKNQFWSAVIEAGPSAVVRWQLQAGAGCWPPCWRSPLPNVGLLGLAATGGQKSTGWRCHACGERECEHGFSSNRWQASSGLRGNSGGRVGLF